MDDRARLEEHIESIARRPDHLSDRLATVLLHRAWPGGSADRMEPDALEWVRRGGAIGAAPAAPACSCDTGRCAVCN